MRDFQRSGRSLAYSSKAMCATSHPQATLAALEVLRGGGNAMDAAITASAVLCVVEPQSTGIGGDCFALVKAPGKPLVGLNGSGRSPKALDPEPFLAGAPFPDTSVHTVTVPGAVDAWDMLLQRFGRRGLAEALQPAIRHAEEGFVVLPRVAFDWADDARRLSLDEGGRRHALPGGRAPREGETVRFPALAASLRAIARGGREAFYRGALAEDMVGDLRALGGAHTLEDFAAHAGEWVEPVSGAYGGLDLAEIPPNGHGVTALVLLNILRHLGCKADDPLSAERYHLLMEAARLAYAVRDTFVADPEKADVPLSHIVSDRLAGELASRIDPKRRRDDLGPVPQPRPSDTIYLCVVDQDGLAVSFINSVFDGFGSGIITRRSGIAMQNRGHCFSLARGHRNQIAPGKRPLHTIIPAMGLAGGEAEMVFGVMGGHYQPVGHVMVMTGTRDYGLDVQAALEAPRIFFDAKGLVAETGIPESVVRDLERRGHQVSRPDFPLGGGQAIVIDRKAGVLMGGSDPRKDGFAAGL